MARDLKTMLENLCPDSSIRHLCTILEMMDRAGEAEKIENLVSLLKKLNV